LLTSDSIGYHSFLLPNSLEDSKEANHSLPSCLVSRLTDVPHQPDTDNECSLSMAQEQAYAIANVSASSAGDATGSTEAQQLLDAFWPKVIEDIKKLTTQDFKNQELPLARIKKIMKLDDDVKSMMISAEAPILFAKAAEIFITELSLRAWIHTEDNKRRTLQRNDIAMAISKYDQFDFLIDIVPREEMKPSTKRAPGGLATINALQMSGGLLDGGITAAAVSQDQVQYILQQSIPQTIAASPAGAQQIQVIQTPQGNFALINGQLIPVQLPQNPSQQSQPPPTASGGDATGGTAGTLQLASTPTGQQGAAIQFVAFQGPNGEIQHIPVQALNQVRMPVQGQPGQQILIHAPTAGGTAPSGVQHPYQITAGGQQFIVQSGIGTTTQDSSQNPGLDDHE